MSLAVIKFSVGAVTSPGILIKFPPTVSRVRYVLDFCGFISATIIPLVSFLPVGTFSLGMKKMEFFPDGILVPTPCSSRPISFANEFFQMASVVPLIRCLYSSDAPVVGSMAIFA